MEVWDFIFGQYSEYSTTQVIIEVIAIIMSVISVLFSMRNSVLVFPFGIISTLLFVYLLYQWNLLGDMVINGYYFIMSVYGWYYWLSKGKNNQETPITRTLRQEWITATAIAIATGIAIFFLYFFTERLESWVSYIDMLTTGIFFAGMWLMARRKLEHWLVLMVGNIISVPLYFYKMHDLYGSFSLTAVLYIFLSIIAYIGYKRWIKYLDKPILTV
ncbi:nicotinamide riboside transporter PnuC [Nonlabens agnitus]|uniref:Nicotinamide riboside transporter PnuC n=1 Tax=Nonlabens agnitus TaxID=870484 RepID=A0A2S9WW01_9FLAO|nr:nicotinamide riboside transporter PnuC [Nonlabens agnitus]PRP67621.1 nicotinamide mononucleotide transporter [Nonlabens agnitus]